jgi:hypothetical protein
MRVKLEALHYLIENHCEEMKTFSEVSGDECFVTSVEFLTPKEASFVRAAVADWLAPRRGLLTSVNLRPESISKQNMTELGIMPIPATMR